jgi:hypothetical protein
MCHTGDIAMFLPGTKFEYCPINKQTKVLLLAMGKIQRQNLIPELFISLRQRTKTYLDFVARVQSNC